LHFKACLLGAKLATFEDDELDEILSQKEILALIWQ